MDGLMTVREFIMELSDYDPDAEIVVKGSCPKNPGEEVDSYDAEPFTIAGDGKVTIYS
jgi:hypothetical protein